jgi:hypothetical protein
VSRRALSAAVSLAVIGALLVGGYVLTRGGGNDVVESENQRFARLASRPLELPTHLASGGECQLDVGAIRLSGIPAEGGLGPLAKREERTLPVLRHGPIYAVIGGGIPRIMDLWPSPDSRWAVQDATLWISKPSYTGPVLIRGGRLDGRSRIRFGGGPDPGPELRLAAGEWDEPATAQLRRAPIHLRERWRVATRTTRIKATGCYSFQVDGEGFSYVLPFAAVLQGGR